MGEMFEEFSNALNQSGYKNKLSVKFVDVLDDNLDGYDEARKVLDQGTVLPVIAVNGKPMFYGGLSAELVLEEVKRLAG